MRGSTPLHWSFFDFISLTFLIILTSCSTPQYSQTDGPTSQLADNTVRYGSIAGLGGAGFFAGKELGGSTTSGALGAGLGVAGGYALNKFGDSKRREAYAAGKEAGAAAARSELVNEKWKREAIYGLPEEGAPPRQATYRRVYVPSREINGVQRPGEYQTVEVFR